MSRPPLPPFDEKSAIEKVRLAEDGWNTRDAAKVALAYSLDTRWRNRAEFLKGREEIQAFLTRAAASRYDTPTNTTTTAGIGSERTATRTGNSRRMD